MVKPITDANKLIMPYGINRCIVCSRPIDGTSKRCRYCVERKPIYRVKYRCITCDDRGWVEDGDDYVICGCPRGIKLGSIIPFIVIHRDN